MRWKVWETPSQGTTSAGPTSPMRPPKFSPREWRGGLPTALKAGTDANYRKARSSKRSFVTNAEPSRAVTISPLSVHAAAGDHLRNKVRKPQWDRCWWCGRDEKQSHHHLFVNCAVRDPRSGRCGKMRAPFASGDTQGRPGRPCWFSGRGAKSDSGLPSEHEGWMGTISPGRVKGFGGRTRKER